MIFKTRENHAEDFPFINMGIFYQTKSVRYLSPGIPPSIRESEKELRDRLFPNIWEGINEL